VRHLILNRPDKRNALNIALLERLAALLEATAASDTVRAVVLRGNGPVFCAGLDLSEATDTQHSHRSAEGVAEVLRRMYRLPQTTIAQVHGAALAGGLGLVSACDLAWATAGAKFGYPEVRRGLVAGLVMTFIRRQLAERHARELLLLGEIIEGERAEAMGLINRAVPHDMLDDAVTRVVDLVLKGAPGAIAKTKAFYNDRYPRTVEADLEDALALHVAVRDAGEAQEGMRAFLERRLPTWDPARETGH